MVAMSVTNWQQRKANVRLQRRDQHPVLPSSFRSLLTSRGSVGDGVEKDGVVGRNEDSDGESRKDEAGGPVVSSEGRLRAFEITRKTMRRMKTVLKAVGMTLRGLIVSAAIMESLGRATGQQETRERRARSDAHVGSCDGESSREKAGPESLKVSGGSGCEVLSHRSRIPPGAKAESVLGSNNVSWRVQGRSEGSSP